ncbi:MAG: mechanosensitive ion channel [Planctomycetes bacterium]|nr:mechanosensitive ion channel [Planctomycetota bacterium]
MPRPRVVAPNAIAQRSSGGQAAKEAAPAPQVPKPEEPSAEKGRAPQPKAADAVAGKKEKLSEAERLAALEREIKAEQKRLEELQAEKEKLEAGEYKKSQEEFNRVDEQLKKKRAQLQELKNAGKTDDALEADVKALEMKRKVALDRFQLAVEALKTLQERIAALEQKIQLDQQAVEKLKGKPPEKGEGAAAPVQPPGKESPANGVPAPAPANGALLPVAPNGGAAPAGPTPPIVEKVATKEVLEARKKAEEKGEAAKVAQEEVQSIAARIENLQKQIELEWQELDLARRQADIADALFTELETKLEQADTAQERQQLRQELNQFFKLRAEAKKRSRGAVDRVRELETELRSLRRQESQARREAEQRAREAEAALAEAQRLESPFAIQNLLRWLTSSGIRVLGTVLGMIVLIRLAKVLSRRLAELAGRGAGRGSRQERENRAHTLAAVFQNAAKVAIIAAGSLMILQEVGVNIGLLLGGAAVVGLGVAFGAQNLIRDYFSGFMILLENQYTLNDVVRIGEIAGQVERITLRVTVLRDLQGVVHFIPNGQIASVSNLTHGWSRAVFDIAVAYKEDVDRVMSVLIDLGQELRKNPAFGPLILEDLTMLGVDEFGDSAVVIKFYIKTRPFQQWTVKREMLRRIKKRFDELGIEMPFPQRTVHHCYDGAAQPSEPAAMQGGGSSA